MLEARNDLTTLLSNYITSTFVLGNESLTLHFYHLKFYQCSSYKIIRKDCVLGGGGVFIGFKNSLIVSELSSPYSEVEMLWAKLKVSNDRPFYLCSFYRPIMSHPLAF